MVDDADVGELEATRFSGRQTRWRRKAREYRTAGLLTILITLQLAAAVISPLREPSDDWLWEGLSLGVVGATLAPPTLLALWAVFGPQSAITRLPLTTWLNAAFALCLAAGAIRNWRTGPWKLGDHFDRCDVVNGFFHHSSAAVVAASRSPVAIGTHRQRLARPCCWGHGSGCIARARSAWRVLVGRRWTTLNRVYGLRWPACPSYHWLGFSWRVESGRCCEPFYAS